MPFIIVREDEAVIVERIGLYHRTLRPGFNVIIPFFETCRKVEWKYEVEEHGMKRLRVFSDYRINTAETICDILPIECVTKDNTKAIVNMIAYYKIVDARKAVYNITDLYAAISNDLMTRLIEVIRTMDSSSLNSPELNTKMMASLNKNSWDRWGVQLLNCALQNVKLPAHITDATNKNVEERRKHEAELASYELQQKKLVEEEKIQEQRRHMALTQCKHECSLREMEKNTRLEALREEAKAIKESGLSEDYFIQKNYSEAWAKLMSQNNNSKIFIPTNFSNFLGAQELMYHVGTRETK